MKRVYKIYRQLSTKLKITYERKETYISNGVDLGKLLDEIFYNRSMPCFCCCDKNCIFTSVFRVDISTVCDE